MAKGARAQTRMLKPGLTLPFCLIGRKRGGECADLRLVSLGRETNVQGQGLDTRAPRPFWPLLVTCVEQVQSPSSLGV